MPENIEPSTDVVDTMVLTPDPALVKSLGTHHTLESAMADLIDNSIDAGAKNITIKLVTSDGALSGISVVDDGRGMDADDINRAMRLGGRREYSATDLGHFGVGLKAAALGNAGVLTVWSQKYGATPVGRRIRKLDLARDYTCEVLSADSATRAVNYALAGGDHGTVVGLSDLEVGIYGVSAQDSRKWLTKKSRQILLHLGLVFHRLLGEDGVKVSIVEVDEAGNEGSPLPVTDIDPFEYKRSAGSAYPKAMRGVVAGVDVDFECHIWPAKQDNLESFRLGSGTSDGLQGFFTYRSNRLLQIGGWNGVLDSSPSLRLARVAIDVDPLGADVQLNPEKSGSKFSPSLAQAINRALSSELGDSTSFVDFVEAAEQAHTDSKKRRRRTVTIVEPGQGFAPVVRKTMQKETSFVDGEEPVDIKWTRLPAGRFFEIDREARVLWLSLAYRDLFSIGHKGSNDAPILKTLIFLLTQDHFTGVQYRSVKKDEAEAWQHLLVTAADEELARRNAKETHE